MSKVDAQRAMRDARYAAYQASRKSEGDPVVTAPKQAPKARSTPKAATPSAGAPEAAEVGQAEVAEQLCGHRSIGNKSCTRPAGHPETNHRYS